MGSRSRSNILQPRTDAAAAREARSATAPRGRSGKAPWLLLVLLDTDVEVVPRFGNHCRSSTRVGGRSRPPALCCYNLGLSVRRPQSPFRRRAGARPRSSSALMLARFGAAPATSQHLFRCRRGTSRVRSVAPPAGASVAGASRRGGDCRFSISGGTRCRACGVLASWLAMGRPLPTLTVPPRRGRSTRPRGRWRRGRAAPRPSKSSTVQGKANGAGWMMSWPSSNPRGSGRGRDLVHPRVTVV